jgi:RND family efflux transporter MFP subunit
MAPRSRQILLPIALLAGAAAIATALILNRPPAELAEPQVEILTVDAAIVARQDLHIPITAQGTVTPLRETVLVSEVQGRIVGTAPTFNAGGFVRAGDTLLRIDDRDYQANLLRARAAVKSAESALIQEKGRAEVARKEWQKLPPGSQRSPEASDLYLRKPQLEQAEAQLLAARADLASAEDDLERTIITAPYDALVRGKSVELGQYVAPGTALAEIFSVDVAEVRLAIPQNKLPYLDLPGVQGFDASAPLIDLYTDVAGEVNHWQARLHRTEGVFDERSRVLFTVARIEDPYSLSDASRPPLRVGTFVNARIDGKRQSDVVVLPRHTMRAGNLVWVIGQDNRLRNRQVSTLAVGGDRIYVTDGLEDGELVSLTALDGTFSGAEVRILSRRRTDESPPAAELAGQVPQGEASLTRPRDTLIDAG